MNSFTIRAAEPRDRPGIERCFSDLQAYERTIEANRAEPEAVYKRYVDDLFAWCSKYSGAILVAEVDATIAGYVCALAREPSEDICELDREFAFITDLIVREPNRRAGIGARLLEAAEEFVIGQGATRLRIGVLAANEAAHRLYRKQGFQPNEIILEKRLTGDGSPIRDARLAER